MAETKQSAPKDQVGTNRAKAANKRRQIKEVKTKLSNLSPKATAEVLNEVVTTQALKQVGGLTNFLREQGVVGVGVGLVFGIQIKAVVDTIMASFVNPITQLVLPGSKSLSAQTFMLVNRPGTNNDTTIGWGAIAYSLMTFIFVAMIVYAAYRLLRLDKLAKKKDK